VTEFRYFADPHTSTASTWTDDPQQCGTCGETRPGYEGPYSGVGELEFVCEECLVSGALAEGDFSTNTGDAGPDHEKRAELEQRTPHLVTWQDFYWPAHCSDFCRFEREVGQRELGSEEFFRKHLHPDLHDASLEWEVDVPARGPGSRNESNSPSVYFFRCLVCDTPVLWWDID
jgi:uncharacterized protein